MKLLLLLSAFNFVNSGLIFPKSVKANDFISCKYIGGSDGSTYECLLSIRNPNGVEFDEIEGNHVTGFGNEDVKIVATMSGSSRTIPSVICRQFPNLYLLSIIAIDVEELSVSAFEECRNLKELYIVFNQITSVPPNIFANSPKLEYIELSRNQIVDLHEESFTGTALSFIAIDFNQLSSFNQNWFTAVNGTLRHLELMQNQITELGENAFSNLRGLTELNFNYNALGTNISPHAFSNLESLESLSLSVTNLTSLNPEWFASLPSLRAFAAQNNEITELAEGTFNSLTNLQELFLHGNRIREISRAAFGSAARQLRVFYISDNRINNIDPYWFSDTDNLEFLLLAGNLCVDEDFVNVGLIRWRMFEELQQCIDNFMLDPWLQCQFEMINSRYTCNFQIHNPNGRDDFEEISGDHIEGQSNENVLAVSAFLSNTRIVPSILCSTFSNLIDMRFIHSNIEDLSEDHFRDCGMLESLTLHDNWIMTIPDFTFRGAPNLVILDIGLNSITTLSENSFSGTRIFLLDLYWNEFTSFNQQWMESINSTLMHLDLFGNSIITLESDAFSNLINLGSLVLGGNPLWDINSNAFDSLVNLTVFNMIDCNLDILDPGWFRNMQELRQLILRSNMINSLPDGIFNSLTSLRFLDISRNNLRSLSADAFGASLEEIQDLDLSDNRIRALDPRLIEGATNLRSLRLESNVCTGRSFWDIINNIEQIRVELSYCLTNFGPESIKCNYYQSGEHYTCSLRIFNPLGRNAFENVDGEHLDGRNDEEVTAMYIYGGRTLNVPRILCEKFNNLETMDFLHDEIEYVDMDSFRNCQNLRRISLYDNKIEVIPPGLFSHNEFLEEVSFSHNRLTARAIPTNIFSGTALTRLDLSQNPIVEFNPAWIVPLASTLKVLEISNISATHLPVLFFNNPSVLEILEASNNPLRIIVPQVFDNLPTLKHLDLSNCQFRQINPIWFRELVQLEFLRLSSNNIVDIPVNAFTNLRNLQLLHIHNNRLRELNAASFGASLSSIQTIFAQQNEITGFDPSILTSGTALNILYLSGNRCSQGNFYNVNENTSIVADSLASCIENFSAETISCNYGNFDHGYTCSMQTFNPLGRNGFLRIDGTHLTGQGDDDVQVIEILNQNTRLVPSIICQQFPNLRTLIIFNSQLDIFTERNLAGCSQLTHLMIYYNDLLELPNFSFYSNSGLIYLELGFNRIRRLEDFTFAGTMIESLDLAGNDLDHFNPRWFEPINSTLVNLDLLNTNLRTLPRNAFMNLRNLRSLVLSRNPLGWNLPRNIFDGLDSLEDLFMSNCEIFQLDPSWFRTLRNVRSLFLNNNEISTLPQNIFNVFQNIEYINLSNNHIWEVGTMHFGNALNSLQTIDLSNNLINIIEESLLREAESLNSMFLNENICTQENLVNIRQDVNGSVAAISQCITNFDIEPSISCDYAQITSDDYSCTLSITDPRGVGLFMDIPGQHLPGRTNQDVRSILVYRQNTRRFPNEICNNFQFLEDISVYSSNLEQLGMSSFTNCRNVKVLMLDGGFIRNLPNNVFRSMQNLEYVSIANNRVFMIGPATFLGTSIRFLDLAFNRLSLIIPDVMNPINETLTILNMRNNRISGFPIDTFDNLGNIEELYLDGNPLTELSDVIFMTMSKLQILSLENCQLTRLNPIMFSSLTNVRTLRLNDNQIDTMPAGLFNSMSSLQLLYIGHNRIGFIDESQFGGSMSSIRIINAPSNRINAIDRNLILNSPNLNNLLLDGNVCIDDSFYDVQENLDNVMDSLSFCLDNFDTEAHIECIYDVNEMGEYTCEILLHNPIDTDFEMIAGQHLGGMSDDDVHIVSIMDQNTKTFPTIICSQFPSMKNIFVLDSNLEILEAKSFSDCRSLEAIYINRNRIRALPANLFINSPRLEFAAFASNRINEISINSFVGTAISSIDLGFNEISRFDSQWFVPISRTLETLDINGNSIRRLENQAFRNLTQLKELILNGNHFQADSNPFEGLENLEVISLSNCGLRELDPAWFSDVPQLKEIILDQNGLAELPANIFDNLTNLELFRMEDNLLTSIGAAPFGSSIGNIKTMDFTHNVITSIDRDFIIQATNLDSLYLEGNICINMNFYEVSSQVEDVLEELQGCF